MLSKKGQISIEMLIVIGIIIMLVALFAVYYLSSINRNISNASSLPEDVSVEYLSDSNFTVPDLQKPQDLDDLCGNGIVDVREVCDIGILNNPVFPTGLTCDDIPNTVGATLTCTDCIEITCN